MRMAARLARVMRAIEKELSTASRIAARAVIAVYRTLISPLAVSLLGPACRFEPSCSRYASEAIARHGVVSGGRIALRRLLRCRPGGGWGYDPVPQIDSHAESDRHSGVTLDTLKGIWMTQVGARRGH